MSVLTLPRRADASAEPARPASRSPSPAGHSAFRADIQGLRAVAVVLVLVYHVSPSALPGGYVGVDVFFVISGFLITGHLLARDDGGVAGLGRFWARRIRRLLPAALVVLAASIVAIVVWVPDVRWAQTAKEALAATFYVENRQLAVDAVDYLRADGPESAVQHYWSLSVEEQFYVVWPVLLLGAAWAARRAQRSRLVVTALVIGVATVASLAMSIWLTHTDPARAYFATSTGTRIWELGAGALLAAFLLRRGPVPRSRRAERNVAAGLVAWFGLAAIVLTAFTYSASTAFPGWRALLPVAGTVAVIAAHPRAGRIDPDRLLGTRPFQTVGDISYSLYLWHWPVIALAPWLTGGELGWLDRIAVVMIGVGLAWLTKRFVEDRYREARPHARLRSTYGRAALGMAAVAAIAGALVVVTDRREADARRLLADATAAPGPCFGAGSVAAGADACPPTATEPVVPDPIIAHEDRTRLYDDDCWEDPPFEATASCTYGDPDAARSIALVGNSHAGHWFAAVEAIAAAEGARVTTFLAAGCTVTSARLTWETDAQADGCAAWGRRVIEETTSGRYDLVVTSQIATRLVDGGELDDRQADWQDGYRPVLEAWAAAGQHVLVVRDTPRMPSAMRSGPDCVASHSDRLAACGGDRRRWVQPDAFADAALAVGSDLVTVADLTGRICAATCAAVVGGVLVYYDTNHMTDTFATTLVPYLGPPLAAALERAASADAGT